MSDEIYKDMPSALVYAFTILPDPEDKLKFLEQFNDRDLGEYYANYVTWWSPQGEKPEND